MGIIVSATYFKFAMSVYENLSFVSHALQTNPEVTETLKRIIKKMIALKIILLEVWHGSALL
jgi:hypothetical protein